MCFVQGVRLLALGGVWEQRRLGLAGLWYRKCAQIDEQADNKTERWIDGQHCSYRSTASGTAALYSSYTNPFVLCIGDGLDCDVDHRWAGYSRAASVQQLLGLDHGT